MSSSYQSYDNNQGGSTGGGYSSNRNKGFSLFVGGLAFNASDFDVKQALSGAGNIVNVRIVTDRETGKSKGYGFVDFDSQEAVDQAIRQYNGMEILGRPIRLDSGGRGNQGKGAGNANSNYGGGYNRGGGSSAYQGSQNQTTSAGNDKGSYSSYNQSSYGGESSSYAQKNSSSYQGGYDKSSYDRYSNQGSSSNYDNRTATYDRNSGYNNSRSNTYGAHSASRYGAPDPSQTAVTTSSYQSTRPSGPGAPMPQNDRNNYNRDRSRSRGRSPSESSSVLEMRKRERQAKKEQFSKTTGGWDRAPNTDEIAAQEAERRAVREAEAQGRDITTIRADLVKQAQWQQSSSSYY